MGLNAPGPLDGQQAGTIQGEGGHAVAEGGQVVKNGSLPAPSMDGQNPEL